VQLITLPIFCLACLAAINRPAWAYAFVLCFYCLEMTLQASVSAFLSNQFLANYILAVVLGLAAAKQVLSAGPGWVASFFTPTLGMVVVLLGWTIISMVWSPSGEQGWKFILEGIPYMAIYLIAATLLISSVEAMTRAYYAFLILGVLTALMIILNPEFGVRGGRIVFRITSVDVSSVLSIGRLGGGLMVVAAVLRVEGQWIKPLRVSGFLIGTLLALLSGSRGQLAFAVVAALAFFPVARPLKSVRAFASLVTMVIVGYLSLTIIGEYVLGSADVNRWDQRFLEGATGARLANVLDLFRAFATTPYAPFVGLGYNAFSAITGAVADTYVHNIIAEVLCELGVPILILLGMILVTAARQGRALLAKVSHDPTARATVATLLALATYDLLIAQKEGQVWNHFVLYMHVCLIARLYRIHVEYPTQDEQWEEDGDEAEGGAEDSQSYAGVRA